MSLLKSAGLISAMTMLSRITGLIRETLTARILGAGVESDAFFVAFRIPNLLRRLFAEGAFSQAFIPILSQTNATDGRPASALLAQQVGQLLFWVLLIIVLLGVLGAGLVVTGMASGLAPESDQFKLTVELTQWMFPYILLISMVALASGVLNTLRKFSLPAFAPVLLNVSFIIAALFAVPYFELPVQALAAAVLVGGVLQVVVLWYGLHRANAWINPIGSLKSLREAMAQEKVRRILRNMIPASLAVSVAQISLIINTNIATHLGPGSVSWISFGDRLMEFPTALLGVALGTVLLPSLSAASTRNDQTYSHLMDWGLRLAVLLSVPAAVGLGVFSEGLVSVLFHYGKFDANDVAMTSQAVIAYSVGVVGLIAVKILAPGFYAKQDVKTPVKIGILVVIVTQLMNLVFVPWLGHAGLPLSVGLGATLNAIILYVGLRRREMYQPEPGWFMFVIKVLLAAGGMGALIWYWGGHYDWIDLQHSPLMRMAWVGVVVAGGGLVYFGLLAALGLSPRRWLRKPNG